MVGSTCIPSVQFAEQRDAGEAVALPSRIDMLIQQAPDCPGRRRFMSDRMDFEVVCPNDHDQTVTFSQEAFEKALKSGALVFHCNTCDTDWPPSHDDIACDGAIREVITTMKL
jgi:hypothetical protein